MKLKNKYNNKIIKFCYFTIYFSNITKYFL